MLSRAQRRRYATRFAVSIAIGGLLAWLLVRGGLPIVPDREAFAEVRPWAVAGYFAMLVGVHTIRGLRWRHLLRPLGKARLIDVVSVCWISFAAILLLPLRMGEVVRPYLITKRSSVRGWQAVGSVGAERVIDGLALSVVFFVALALTTPLSPLPDRVGKLHIPVATVPGAASGALALFVACFALMVLFYWRRRTAERLIRGTVGRLSARVAERLAEAVGGVASGLGFLPSARRAGPFALETVGYWGLNALSFWVLAWGCGLEQVGFAEACVVMGCLGIGIVLPGAPGFFGSYQLSVYLALAMFVRPDEVAGAGAAYVFISYCCQIVLHLVAGAAGWIVFRYRASSTVRSAPSDRSPSEASAKLA